MNGTEGSILLLQAYFDGLSNYGRDLKDMKLHPMYASIFRHILDKPNFSTILSQSLRSTAINEELLQNLSGALHLSVPERVGLGLALSDIEDHDTRMCGKSFCISQITELCANPVAFESTDLIQRILMFLSRSEGLSKHVDSFMHMLSLVQLKEGSQFVITPFLPNESRGDNLFRNLELLNKDGEDDFDAILAEMKTDISMADVMCELGYGCTANMAQCKDLLSLFLPLSNATVAKILGAIARTYAGLDDSQNDFATFHSALGGNGVLELPSLSSWNVDVLVDSIKQIALGIDWVDVMEKLDHEGFYIPNEAAFAFFMSVYRRACQEPFPLHAICGSVWKNVEGQLSFLNYAVSAPPEVFTFSHSETQLSYDDAVLRHTLQSGPNRAWSCHDLLVVLCQLSERGHASSVRTVLESPLNHFPEVLLLGMAHVHTTYNLIQNEVASVVLPMALKSASASGLILTLFHVNPNLLLRGLIDAVDLDTDSVSRILDACHEVKILSQVLDMSPFHSGIRLAVLASKKKIMNLESWLSSQLVSNKDAFYEECIKFLKDIEIGDQDGSANCFHPSGSLFNMYLKACPTVLKVLLGSELIKSRVEEMENLGSWLGKRTIGKNQVIRAREIDPKSLIIEAYEKGLMLAVIPVTTKILEPCSNSIAYQPPNPWTMAILGLLAEIYRLPNLKLKIKCHIRVFFRHLSVDPNDVALTSLLKNRVRQVEGNPDFSSEDIGSSQPPTTNECATPLHHSLGTLREDEELVILGFFSDQLLLQRQTQYSVNQVPVPEAAIEQVVVSLHWHFQSVLPVAIDRAVKEIASSRVQHSVSIATQTAKEIILKDYGMEPDETIVHNAARMMVAWLAGSLAGVTCKEPLRGLISSQLRHSLEAFPIGSELREEVVQVVTNGNLYLGCALIEQAAIEKAVQTIDWEIAQQLWIRRKSVGATFLNASLYAQGHQSHLQQLLYEDLARFPGQNWYTQSSNAVPVGPSGGGGLSRKFASATASGLVSTGIAAVPQLTLGSIPASAPSTHILIGDGPQCLETNNTAPSYPALQVMKPSSSSAKEHGNASRPANATLASERPGTNVSKPLITLKNSLDKYQTISEKLENLLANDGEEGEIQGVIAEVPAVILRCISRDEAALAVAQKAFKSLYENASNNAHVNAHLAILSGIRDVSKLIVKELTSWVIYSEECRKFDRDIAIGLIRSGLLNLAEFNVHMAKLVNAGRNKAATEFAISLIQTLAINHPQLIPELHNLVDALAKLRPDSEDYIKGLKDSKDESSAL